jgi:hypothetical protein
MRQLWLLTSDLKDLHGLEPIRPIPPRKDHINLARLPRPRYRFEHAVADDCAGTSKDRWERMSCGR